MPTQYIHFKGPCKWAMVRVPSKKFNNYTIDVYLDKAGLKTLKDCGLQLNPKEDENGSYVTFRRPHQKVIKNELKELGSPAVVDKDGNTFPESIGNGSIVDITVDVYDTMKGKGHTLREVKVLTHVPYEKPVV